jgi:hypothetical protein
MSSISRLFGRVAAALFYTTLLAANTAFADEHNPAQVLAREWAVQLPKALHQEVLLEAEQVMGHDKTKPRLPGDCTERLRPCRPLQRKKSSQG